MAKKVIGVDIDDVLAAMAQGFVDYSNQKWGTNLRSDDYDEHWSNMWQVSVEEARKRRDVLVDDKVYLSYAMFDTAKPVLTKLKKDYKLILVTSRHRAIIQDTFEWIDHYYKGIFSEIHSAGIWDDWENTIEDRIKLTKATICKEIGADFLIDDQPKHCIAVAEAGITAILFGNYRWNRNVKLRPNMVRAKTWKEVEEYFDARTRK